MSGRAAASATWPGTSANAETENRTENNKFFQALLQGSLQPASTVEIVNSIDVKSGAR